MVKKATIEEEATAIKLTLGQANALIRKVKAEVEFAEVFSTREKDGTYSVKGYAEVFSTREKDGTYSVKGYIREDFVKIKLVPNPQFLVKEVSKNFFSVKCNHKNCRAGGVFSKEDMEYFIASHPEYHDNKP
ncbi:MAG TPA: hypothetical protein VNE86_02160 [Nitrososphaerales archaeon]|nr:hypothetical protein [Nitrososphaerales archaeon]